MTKLIKPKKCIVVDRVVDDDFMYGSFKDTDALVDSQNVEDRIRMAKLGYGVDKLKDDTDPRVRAEVAKGGYFIQSLIKDSHPDVRKAVQQFIKG